MAVEQCITMRNYNEYVQRKNIPIPAAEIAAWTSSPVAWKSLPVKVHFHNRCQWQYKGTELSHSAIINWINTVWNIEGKDCFQMVYGNSPNDIRVEFKHTAEGSWSKIGNLADIDKHEPSMVLNFTGMRDAMIKATIIHQFGHALGLGHALMKPSDWEVLKPFVDQDQMRRSYGVQKLDDFEVQWSGKGMGDDAHYDEDSIMHYITNASWIKREKYRTKDSLRFARDISDAQREVLKKFLDSVECIRDETSRLDKSTVLKLYCGEGPTDVPVAPLPAPEPNAPEEPPAKMYLGNPAPTMRDLSFVRNPTGGPPFKLFPKIAGKWREIGEILGLEDYLDQWRNKESDERIRNVFSHWKDNAKNLPGDPVRYAYSWDGLRYILEDAGCSEIAEKYFKLLQ